MDIGSIPIKGIGVSGRGVMVFSIDYNRSQLTADHPLGWDSDRGHSLLFMLILQIIISFLVGGLFIGLQTIVAERVPLRWRGIVLTIPSTLALGLFFVGFTEAPEVVPEAIRIVPAGTGTAYIFALAFAFLSQFSLLLSLIGALLIWAAAAAILMLFPPENFILSIFIHGAPLMIIAYLLIRKLPQATKLTPVPANWKHIGIRSLIGGSILGIVVILTNTLGALWGVMFSMFPATFTSTFLIYYHVHGKKIIPSVAKSLFLPGIIGFLIYAWIASITFPVWGIWWGTLVAYAGMIPLFLFYSLVSKRVSKK